MFDQEKAGFRGRPDETQYWSDLDPRPVGILYQELFGEIDSDNMSSWTDAFGRWNGGCTHAATNIKNGHVGNERETIDSPPAVAIPE